MPNKPITRADIENEAIHFDESLREYISQWTGIDKDQLNIHNIRMVDQKHWLVTIWAKSPVDTINIKFNLKDGQIETHIFPHRPDAVCKLNS